MSYGPLSVYTDSIASGASTSSGIYLDRSYKNVLLQVGTMSTAVNLAVHGAVASGTAVGTYYPIYHPSINSSTVTNNPFVISQSVGTNGGIVPVPNGLPYMRFVGTAVVSGGVQFKVICSD